MLLSDSARQRMIRELFARARNSYPRWHHRRLLELIWKKRPKGTNVWEMIRISDEFALTSEKGSASGSGGSHGASYRLRQGVS
jgi:hypothetical protein